MFALFGFHAAVCCRELQCAAVCCSDSQYVQYVAVCCSVLQEHTLVGSFGSREANCLRSLAFSVLSN